MTQWMTVVTLEGAAATFADAFFKARSDVSTEFDVDAFCSMIRRHGRELPIVYFAEWIDRWSMGYTLPGPDAFCGQHFQICCFTPAEARDWALKCGSQYAEQQWYSARLREAATAVEGAGFPTTVIAIREVLNVSTDDSSYRAAAATVPDWLAHFTAPANPR